MKPFLPAILWSVVILILSIIPGGISLPKTIWDLFTLDKWGHAFFYGILTILILKGWSQKKALTNQYLILSVLGASLYGILMECIQFSFFPNRYFEILDIFANIIGSFGSLFVFRFFIK